MARLSRPDVVLRETPLNDPRLGNLLEAISPRLSPIVTSVDLVELNPAVDVGDQTVRPRGAYRVALVPATYPADLM
jgi:hypothetical protein